MQLVKEPLLPMPKLKCTPHPSARRTRPLVSAYRANLQPLFCSSPAVPLRPLTVAVARPVLPPPPSEWASIVGQSPLPLSPPVFRPLRNPPNSPSEPPLIFHTLPPAADASVTERQPEPEPELELAPEATPNRTQQQSQPDVFESLRMIDENGSGSVSGLFDESVRIISPAPAPPFYRTDAFVRKPLHDVNLLQCAPPSACQLPNTDTMVFTSRSTNYSISGAVLNSCECRIPYKSSSEHYLQEQFFLSEGPSLTDQNTNPFSVPLCNAQFNSPSVFTYTFVKRPGSRSEALVERSSNSRVLSRSRSRSHSRTRILTNPLCRRRTPSQQRYDQPAASSIGSAHTTVSLAMSAGAVSPRIHRRRSTKGNTNRKWSRSRSSSRDRQGHATLDHKRDRQRRSSAGLPIGYIVDENKVG